MAQLDFPPSPSTGDVYVQGSITNVSTGYDLDGNLASALSSFTSLSANGYTSFKGTGFSSDGTNMYVFSPISSGDPSFYQFSLSTAWDVTTASYANKSFTPTSSNNWYVHLIRFDPTGTKMYAGGEGQARNTLYEYTLSTPWDLSTANSTATDSLPTKGVAGVSPQELENIIISPNGSYVYGFNYNTGTLHRWTLNTPWNLSSRTSNSPDQTTSALYTWSAYSWGLDISNDGTKLYVTNGNPVGIGEWTLSTPYSISGLSTSPNTSSDWNGAAYQNLVIGKDGLKLYATSTSGVAHRDMGNSSAVDLSTPESLEHIFTGTKWKLLSKKYSYSGATPANVGNATQLDLSAGNFFDINLLEGTAISFTNPPSSGFAKKFQVKLKIVEQNSSVYGYSLGTASYDNVSYSVTGQETEPTGVSFNSNGTKMYIIGYANDNIHQYSLSSAYDLTTVSYDSVSFNVSSLDNSPHAITFNNDGTKMYVAGSGLGGHILQFSLSSPYDISTSTYDSFKLSVGSQEPIPRGIAFSSDGSNFYMVGEYGSNSAHQYILTTPYDLSTASYDSTFSLSSQTNAPEDISFNNNGTKMYVLASSNRVIYEYNLSTAWDISTALYNSVNFSVGSQDTAPTGIVFNNDGTKIFVSGRTNDSIYQYTTSQSTAFFVTWPNSITWETGSAPTLPELGQTDVLEFYTSDGGTTYYGKLKEDNVS
jgi:DNA-binding beta-propeller fold protein YncE